MPQHHQMTEPAARRPARPGLYLVARVVLLVTVCSVFAGLLAPLTAAALGLEGDRAVGWVFVVEAAALNLAAAWAVFWRRR